MRWYLRAGACGRAEQAGGGRLSWPLLQERFLKIECHEWCSNGLRSKMVLVCPTRKPGGQHPQSRYQEWHKWVCRQVNASSASKSRLFLTGILHSGLVCHLGRTNTAEAQPLCSSGNQLRMQHSWAGSVRDSTTQLQTTNTQKFFLLGWSGDRKQNMAACLKIQNTKLGYLEE